MLVVAIPIAIFASPENELTIYGTLHINNHELLTICELIIFTDAQVLTKQGMECPPTSASTCIK